MTVPLAMPVALLLARRARLAEQTTPGQAMAMAPPHELRRLAQADADAGALEVAFHYQHAMIEAGHVVQGDIEPGISQHQGGIGQPFDPCPRCGWRVADGLPEALR